MADDESTIKPRQSIRRFDVFAEFERQKQVSKGEPADVAKGNAIWLAKWVASQRGRSKSKDDGDGTKKTDYPESKWKSLDGKEQTDRLFDEEIIDHMGETFYTEVLVPAVELARKQKLSYEKVRDSIREDWQLPKAKR
jgi:hypothetical protein